MSDQNSDLVQNILPLELKKKRGSMTSWRGNKYPEVKLRGFYSDIASYQNAERTNPINRIPDVNQSHSWVVNKEDHLPYVNAFDDLDPEEFKILLAEQIHGATTEIIKTTDFTTNGYLPKCFLPFYTPPGSLPRKVQIDRLRRLYQSMNIADLLAERGLTPEIVMPSHRPIDEVILLNVNPDDPAPFPPFLPLHYFDNEDYEVWTPEEWFNKGIEDGVYKPIPGKALLPNVASDAYNDPKDPRIQYKWIDVGVLDFDYNTKLWLVQKLTSDERVLDEDANPVVNRGLRPDGSRRLRSNQYWVPRVQLQFVAEDPRQFADRVQFAHEERKRTENYLRYQFYVDSMPHDGVQELETQSFKRMLDYIRVASGLRTLPEKNREDLIALLEREVNVDFQRTMNKITFDKIITENKDTFQFVISPPVKQEIVPRVACCEDVPIYDFDEQYYNFSFVSLLTRKEAIDALSKVKVECNRVGVMSMFQIPNKHMKLDEFEQSQTQQISQTSLYLKDSWINTLKTGIRSSFLDSGKGWFNIKETDWSVYQISKLKKFMELVKFSMQDSLRYLVQDSLVNYTQAIVDSCWQVVDIKEDETNPYIWPENDLINSYIKPKKNAMFLVELQIDKNGPKYNVNYENFETVLSALFEKAISSTQAVPQLEKFVMEDIFFSGTPLLESVGNLEPHIVELKETIVRLVRQAIIPLKAYAKVYARYINLMNLNIDNYIKDYEKTEKTIEQVREELKMHLREKDILERLIPMNITIGPFYIVTSKIRESLSNKRKALIEALLNYQTRKVKNKAEEVNNGFRDIQRKLFDKPNTIEELSEHREWMKSIPGLMDDKKDDVTAVLEEFALLDEFLFNLSNEDFTMKWGLLSWQWKIANMCTQVEEQHVEEEERFRKSQVTDSANLNDKMDQLIMNVAGLSAHSNLDRAHEVANDCRRLNKGLKECQELAALYNNRERLFGTPITSYDKLNRLIKDFDPYKNLWITSSDWLKWHDSWMNDPISSIDAENIEKNVTESYKSMHKAIKQFADSENVQAMAVEIKNQIEEFRPNIPLIQALRNPGMRNRHWEMLTEELKLPVRPKRDLNFRKCLEMGFDKHIDKISKVAEIAGKEYTIEQALDKMENEWKPIKFEVLPYKNTGTYIVKASDEVSQLLDDHIVMTQSMSFSPFKKAFEERISSWENKLKITQDVLDEWLVCQRSWLYLEPIFSSEDIIRQLPVESKRYQTMERIWRKIMKQAKENPEVISLCPDARLRDQLKECNKLLEQVQKGLSEYLETKRTSFPRFYFLSDDELLQILSQTKDPQAVQPHLRKCFENIYKVKFESDMRISTMYSAEAEEVGFRENIYPVGNVEEWMLEIERVMRESLRQIIHDSLEDYKVKPRTQWVLKWPGQIVIAGCQTYWTMHVSKALEENKLPDYHTIQLRELDDLRQLVRGKLTGKERQTLSALIVIEVHARDVVINLLSEKVSDVNDFEWISQLRYYWNQDNLYIRAVNAEFLYGYEYLGNTSRLVITPLTDRCYLTLTGALHLKFGGAPAGPAGTGKTETTKDLAKAMAIQCVVFNCSDQLDFMAMGKFFKGLASAGAWACFDEFNRIDIEVLSVVAQQIQQIQQALTQRAERFIFEGVEIALKQSCAVFITMNPGYAGRTELPDNLKALFRPVAMMVPDYALIAEISLFSFGFSDAKLLAKKIVTTFKLSSEQLSSQDHYDFGMRAVKSVISAAGNLKRQNPDMNEELICLRAIRDVNVPKFLQEDLKLFNGIVSDLFPKIKEEPIDYGNLESALRKTCKTLGIKDVDNFILKCIQLYETTVVRHGLMLVGPTGSGKTKCYETLKGAMSSLAGQPSPAGTPFEVVYTYILNPKSITMGQLYGEFDLMTHEWTDGILSCLMSQGVQADNDDKRWYIFDGPVDAVWIENMNTVLDDNKKLCLTSGEIIKMTDPMTMMFEVADLAVASPATVSRCGMVYLEPSILGLKPFVECWMRKLPDSVFAHRDLLNKLFDGFLEPAIDFIRKNAKEIIPTMDSNLTFSLLKLMDCFLAPYRPRDKSDKAKMMRMDKPVTQEAIDRLGELIEPWFLFSLVWSVGASCENNGRLKFSEWVRTTIKSQNVKMPFPSEGLVYDYMVDDGGLFAAEDENKEDEGEQAKKAKIIKWKNWMADLPDLSLSNDTKFSDIIVPTIDNVRNSFLVETLLRNEKVVLCVGPTGTGKTLTISNKLTRSMPKEFTPEFIVFSAKTSANQTQDLIDSKLDKRRKGIFGPPLGKLFVFFIDDLNMPALEVYGAQPPIELIRQWMDFRGWYDRKAVGEFRNLVDINFCCAMGPPGGGRNPVTARLTRHFNHVSFVEMEDASMKKIFGTILNWWIKNNDQVSDLGSKLVECCISVYKTISEQLLPTPAKSHYTFNLRDLSKTFQGILMGDVKSIGSVEQLVKLWYHESCRVFQDRLINDEDRGWFKDLLKQKMKQYFNLEFSDVITQETIIFGDFMIPNADPRVYAEIDDFKHMKKVIEDYLEDYNQINISKMKLVLFMDAMKHIARISRIIRQPFGNALLLGVGGSGRQSLTRLAAHMAEYECFQIELAKNYGMTEWRDDLRKVMLSAGMSNTQTVFLFSDTQIKSESFLEDLNNILNAGDVPNIYSMDELDQIYTAMKSFVQEAGLPPTKTNLFSTYTKRVRNNLHTVICMSPIGEIFRARLRQFPALVNCCTIDWFSEWPKDALESVAMTFLQEMPDLETSDEVIDGLMNICQEMHQTVVVESLRYKEEQGRFNYVTPTSYLELLSIFSKIFGQKKNELIQAKRRTKTGLDKLLTTEKEVSKLRVELEQMQPQLEEAVQETISTMATIEVDSKVAAETRSEVQKEEEEAIKKAKEAKAIADDAQRDLDEALPALDAALASLKSLNKNDVSEVKAMKNPPEGVKMVMEAVCIMKQVPPKKVQGDKPGTKVDDYTDPARTLLNDPGKFLESLFTYDKENIPDKVIQNIERYIENDKFTPAAIAQVSKACTSICLWVRAMYKFYFVNRSVAPKREAQRIAQEELAATQRTLANAKAKLKEVEEKLATLQAKYDDSIRKKSELEVKVKECEEKVIRAGKLVSGLGDEKIRWAENVKQLDFLITNVIGDVLAASGFIAYLGPFIGSYRESMTQKWIDHLTKYQVPHTESPEVVKTLGDPVKIRNWQLAGLPKDLLSVQNGVIVQYSQRWPLFIDPQGQANKWVKNLERENGMDVIKLSDRDFLRSLENAIRFGKPCLLENVGTELDPALEPVLLRQTFKQSGSLVIKLGDAIIPYHEDFKFYITTKLPNPHYTPEVSVKVTLINFTLSPSGLEDQMLGCVVAEERPDLEEAKNQLIVSNSIMKNELKELEDTILLRLSKSENPVDDIELINALEASKIKSTEIKAKVVVSEQTERDIDSTRSQYVPVAINTQILFFCVSDLANIDPMYQYSLEWFTKIFLNSIQQAAKADSLKDRIVNINDHFTFNLYSNVCRSLFEKHKLLFAFLLTVRILMNKEQISMEEYRFFLAGGTSRPKQIKNPAPDWISERAWLELLTLESLSKFGTFTEDFKNHLKDYKRIFDSVDPHREPLPEVWNNKLDSFQKIIVLKCLRPDKVTNAMQDFVAANIGQRFIEPQTADLHLVFKDSAPATPLIFVLSQGTDPAADLYKFAEEMKFSKKLSAISLGQGQGPRAEAMMKASMERGLWIFFQNCHLAPSWMPSLERLVEQIDPEHVHKDFRLWLTSMPSPKFPVMILQNGSKMTVEPPRGIKANLLRSYTTINDDFLNACTNRVEAFKFLLFSLCLFHGVALERRKFGPLGFNIPYEFTDGDLRICMSQLKMFLMEYADIPFKVLKYTAGHINYGGRVTDDWDRRCIMNVLEDFYNPVVMSETHAFDDSKVYHQLPSTAEHASFMAYVKSLPINDTPEIFGLHDNANITFAQNETFRTLADLVELQPKTASGGGVSREEIMEKTARDILEKVPKPFNLPAVIEKFPVMYEQSMNTVLVQEIIRYNKLLSSIHRTLQDLLKALKGLVVMSQQLEEMSTSLYNNQVPAMWAKAAYPSLKPLAAWVSDLILRLKFIQNWIDQGMPNVYWISGFFFPQAFLTGTLQNYARKNVISIDTISFGFDVMKTGDESQIAEAPKDGCYIRGLYIEGARWDPATHFLGESKAKELYSEVPIIWLIPSVNRSTPNTGIYMCPVYKTLTRAGTLSTTGHSTNFVFAIELPTNKKQNYWIKRGVAMLCALNY